MDYALSALYLLSFSFGFANLALALLSWRRGGRRADFLHAAAVVCLMPLMAFYDLHQITEDTLGWRIFTDGPTYYALAMGLQVPLLLVAPRFLTRFFGFRGGAAGKPRRVASRLAIAAYASVALLSLALAAAGFAYDPWQYGDFFQPARIALVAATCTLAPVAGLMALFAGPEGAAQTRRARVAIAIVCFAVFPAFLVQLGFRGPDSGDARFVDTENIFFVLWNAASMGYYFKLLLGRGAAHPVAAALVGLSEREREITLLVARGKANKDIAAELGISPLTVKNHLYSAYRKLGVQSRYALIARIGAVDGVGDPV